MLTNRSIRSLRRVAAVGVFSAGLALGAASAGAQDLHSGGVSPNVETRDAGAAQTEVLGATTSRDGALPVTGSDAAGLAILGATAIAAGTGAVVASKRRARLSA